MDINVSAGYRPSVSLYGEINKLFDEKIFPIGSYGRVSVVPFKRRWGYVGFELEPSRTFFRHKDSGYEVQARLVGGTISRLPPPGPLFSGLSKKPFFVEAGLDFTHFFTADNPPPGYLRPSVGAGRQF